MTQEDTTDANAPFTTPEGVGIGTPTEANPDGPNPGTGDDQPGAAEAIAVGEAETEKRGKIVQTYLVRVTLRRNAGDDPDDEVQAAEAKAELPTNDDLEAIVGDALFAELGYFERGSINASAEQV